MLPRQGEMGEITPLTENVWKRSFNYLGTLGNPWEGIHPKRQFNTQYEINNKFNTISVVLNKYATKILHK